MARPLPFKARSNAAGFARPDASVLDLHRVPAQNDAMRKRVQFALAVLLVVLVGVIAWQIPKVREPLYQGKSLSVWLEGYIPNPDTAFSDEERRQRTDAAVRELGTNAIPTLLRMLRAKDAAWKLTLMRLVGKQRLFRIGFTPAAGLNFAAGMAFVRLQESASNSVPALIKIYDEDRSDYSRNAVVIALGAIGPAAPGAVPCLLRAATNSEFSIRNSAVFALGRVHAHPELAVPLLIRALRDSDIRIRFAAVSSLRQFGADAKPAFPAVLEWLKDEDKSTRLLAAQALKVIDPEAAAKAGVK
jgi:HEAT repeat protein